MSRYVMFLRGINVGGKNRLPMQEFRALLVEHGCENVSTYIQSGNAVFQYSGSPVGLPDLLSNSIHADFGFTPQMLMFAREEYASILEANPYGDVSEDPRHVHVWMSADMAETPDVSKMSAVASDDEDFLLKGKVLYLHAPSGIGRSKLAANVERYLGVAATARNWRTMTKVQDMVAKLK